MVLARFLSKPSFGLSDCLLVAPGHLGTRLPPDSFQIASQLLADCLQVAHLTLIGVSRYSHSLQIHLQIIENLSDEAVAAKRIADCHERLREPYDGLDVLSTQELKERFAPPDIIGSW